MAALKTPWRAYLQLARFDRPIGTFLLLWPTLWALWLASDGAPDSTIVLIFVAGTFLMRAAGCILNDIADRNFDRHVRRTKMRPLASGALSVKQAFAACIVLLLPAAALLLFLNRATQLLALGGLAVAALYPFAKRITHLPQLVLGVAFSWGIPMAYTATRGELPGECWWLFAANFVWIVAYDTQYAMADREDDLQIGVKSTAILFGNADNLIVALLHCAALIILLGIGLMRGLSWHFYLGLGLALAFAVYQQVLCKDREREACLRAFLNNNWFGAMVFCGVVLGGE